MDGANESTELWRHPLAITCFFVGTTTQLVILTPHIPYRGQGGGKLLLRYSMICVSDLKCY